jgi:hypothetical protein
MEQSGGGNFEERTLHLPLWMLKKRQGGEDGYVNLESLDCDEANTPFNVDTKRAMKDTVNQYIPARACSPWPCPRSRSLVAWYGSVWRRAGGVLSLYWWQLLALTPSGRAGTTKWCSPPWTFTATCW